MSDTVGGPALHAVCRSAATAVPPSRYVSASAATRPQNKKPSKQTSKRTSSRAHSGRPFQLSERPARCLVHIGRTLDRKLLQVSVLLCLAGSVGLCWPAISKMRPTAWVSSAAEASINPPVSRCLRFSRCHGKAEAGAVKLDPFSSSTYAPSVKPRVTGQGAHAHRPRRPRKPGGARMEPVAKEARGAQSRGGETCSRSTETEPEAFRPAGIARGRSTARRGQSLAPPFNFGTLTSLEDFETAPFPYHGTVPTSGRPFLNAGTEGHRGHVNFRGEVLWESETFSDDRVLLHIPPGFDPETPRSHGRVLSWPRRQSRPGRERSAAGAGSRSRPRA